MHSSRRPRRLPQGQERKLMARRRPAGKGSVFRHNGTWAGQLDVHEWNQPRRRKTVYGPTQAHVLNKLDDLRQHVQLGAAVPTGRSVTVGTYLEEWLTVTLPGEVLAGRLKRSTLASYTDQTLRHIVPTLGNTALVELSPRQLRAWLSAKLTETSARGRPLSARTVAYLHGILRAALAQAVRDELLTRNPATLVRPPRHRSPTVVPLTVDEAHRLLAAASNHRLAALWLLLVTLGVRRGEALALHWDDLDLDAGTITISRSLQRLLASNPSPDQQATELVEVVPKTDASVATLPLPGQLVGVLREHRRQQLRERLAAGCWDRNDLVFTTEIGTYLEPRNVTRAFGQLCQAASLRPLRLHDLRHSAASFLLLQGVDLKTVQTMLRHTRLATTADLYLHVHPELQRGAVESMERLLHPLAT